MRIRFLGSGDAFGSGGRLQTCILLETPAGGVLVDCGASALIAMRRFAVEPNTIDTILLSHLHGDHFGGIPFFILDAQLVSKRIRPLVIAGPAGTKERIHRAMEVLFPGSSTVPRGFKVEIVELEPERPRDVGPITVTPYLVEHASGAPALALRMACAGKTVTYTGDTAWTDALIPAARGSDLLIAEAYFYDKRVPFHLDLQTLLSHLPELRTERLVITHMSADMLGRLDALPCEWAEDGRLLEL